MRVTSLGVGSGNTHLASPFTWQGAYPSPGKERGLQIPRKYLARLAGFEPATSASAGLRSILLSHRRITYLEESLSSLCVLFEGPYKNAEGGI
jgi:hypothetical protein